LDELNRQNTQNLIGAKSGTEIYLGGGGGAAEFPDGDKAREFGQDLDDLYRKATVAGSITWVALKVDPADFASSLKKAERLLQRRKESKARPAPMTASPLVKVCDLCGCLPAIGARPHVPGEAERMICSACRRRHQGGHAYKHSLVYRELERAWAPGQVDWPEDLEEIGDQSRPAGYLGLISADGNRAGQVRQKYLIQIRKTGGDLKAAYGRFSRTLDGATRLAAVEAVAQCLGPPEPNKYYPVQFFITGGDDLLMAVPAHLSVPLAICFCGKFEHYFEHGPPVGPPGEFEGLGLTATMSVGVAIAKDHYPLNSLRQSAHELLRSAKALSWERSSQGEEISTIDVLATSGTQLKPLAAQRQEELAYGEALLSQRPYTVGDLEKLKTAIRRLKASGFPRSKLLALGEALFRGRMQACLDCLVLLSRLSQEGDPSPREALLRLAHDFGLDYFPWRLQPGQPSAYETPLLDLIELYEFIH
jgi:hypothetical protein